MTTVLIIVCIAFCIAVVLAIVSHLGLSIAGDLAWRKRIARHYAIRTGRRRRLRT